MRQNRIDTNRLEALATEVLAADMAIVSVIMVRQSLTLNTVFSPIVDGLKPGMLSSVGSLLLATTQYDSVAIFIATSISDSDICGALLS